MQHLEPVGFNLEEAFVASQFPRGLLARRQWQAHGGVGHNFLQQRWHRRNLGTTGGERKRAACQVVVQFGGARLPTSRLARTLAPPKMQTVPYRLPGSASESE